MDVVKLGDVHPEIKAPLVASCGENNGGGAFFSSAYVECVGKFGMEIVNHWGLNQSSVSDPETHWSNPLKKNFPEVEENRYGTQYAGFDVPTITMVARDESGEGVAGLRVRVRVVDKMYTNIPSLAAIVSCGLDDPLTEGNDRPLKGVREMDSQTEYTAPCITGEDGYVSMKVSILNVSSGEPTGATGIPEFIKSAPDGVIYFQYEAYQVDDAAAADYSLQCQSQVFSVNAQSEVASVIWGTDTSEWERELFEMWGVNIVGDARATIPAHPSQPIEADLGGSGAFQIYPGIDVVPQIGERATPYSIVDGDLGKVTRKYASLTFVNTPPYIPGWQTVEPTSCWSSNLPGMAWDNLTLPSKNFETNPVNLGAGMSECVGGEAGSWGIYTSVLKDYGLTASSAESDMFNAYPVSPMATTFNVVSNFPPGRGWFAGCAASSTGTHERHEPTTARAFRLVAKYLASAL